MGRLYSDITGELKGCPFDKRNDRSADRTAECGLAKDCNPGRSTWFLTKVIVCRRILASEFRIATSFQASERESYESEIADVRARCESALKMESACENAKSGEDDWARRIAFGECFASQELMWGIHPSAACELNEIDQHRSDIADGLDLSGSTDERRAKNIG